MTARQIQVASAGFRLPYGSLSVARSDLLELTRRGWIGRQEIPSIGPGQCELLYHLKRKARVIAPELGELPKRSAIFRPVAANVEHSLGIAELVSLFERDAAMSDGRVMLLDFLRDRELAVKVDARPREEQRRQLIPDYTLVARVDGVAQLFFVELQNRGAVISPGRDASLPRSFKGKLWRYKSFLSSFRDNRALDRLLRTHGIDDLPGFRVLVVSTRSEQNLANLIAAAAPDFRTLFYFATLDRLRDQSLFLGPCWSLPVGERRSIADPVPGP